MPYTPPPYVFVEFPKAVRLPDGSVEIVQNADEEAALTSEPKRPRGRPPKVKTNG